MKNRTMDLLKYRPFPELAAAVRQCKPAVMERWQNIVRDTLPTAHELTLVQVRDGLPKTIDAMADALEAHEPHATKELMDQSSTHGEDRFDQNYNLSELMIEYGLLRPILIEEATHQLDRIISVEEVQALNLAVDVVTRRGVVMYVNQQKAEMQSLVEAQSKYLSFLSHDLRGSLNGVLLMIEVLHRDLDVQPQFAESLDDLERMRRSILDTVSTMDRFLHAERFRSGKVEIKRGPVDVTSLLNDLAGQFSYQLKDKKLVVKCEAPDGLEVITDRELVTIILQNLIGNAIKYSKDGAIRLVCAGADGVTRISVIDQGPGIDPAKLSQIFQPFARGDTHGQGGAGLGLSIARHAAELLGAKLWAESKLGQGSKFHLDLPATPA